MLVIVDVIIGKNGISTEVFSDIRNARKFRDKLMQKYGNELKKYEPVHHCEHGNIGFGKFAGFERVDEK